MAHYLWLLFVWIALKNNFFSLDWAEINWKIFDFLPEFALANELSMNLQMTALALSVCVIVIVPQPALEAFKPNQQQQQQKPHNRRQYLLVLHEATIINACYVYYWLITASIVIRQRFLGVKLPLLAILFCTWCRQSLAAWQSLLILPSILFLRLHFDLYFRLSGRQNLLTANLGGKCNAFR